TIPLTSLVEMLQPGAPADVRAAASRLRYRDLVVVAVMLDRPRVTDQTWIYVPDPEVPFGRLHEPTNWSERMAPPGQTLLVTEHFCCCGDATWRTREEDLAERTVAHLARLGFISPREVIASAVVRVPKAYPLFEVGYREHHERICAYLGRFRNLEIAGRGGTFKYLNMDHAIAAGIEAAERILTRHGGETREARGTPVLAGTAR
ncbi:MAG: FAD-dependent oxidoreductase, partial [candidate division NC10 bacterium]